MLVVVVDIVIVLLILVVEFWFVLIIGKDGCGMFYWLNVFYWLKFMFEFFFFVVVDILNVLNNG